MANRIEIQIAIPGKRDHRTDRQSYHATEEDLKKYQGVIFEPDVPISNRG